MVMALLADHSAISGIPKVGHLPACSSLSEVPAIAAVQQSRAFREGVEVIAAQAHRNWEPITQEDVDRVCRTLEAVRSEGLPGLVLVFSVWHSGLETQEAIFALVGDSVTPLTTPVGSGGTVRFDLDAWNLVAAQLLRGSTLAPALVEGYGCLVFAVKRGLLPSLGCTVQEVLTEQRDGATYHVVRIAPSSTLRFLPNGSLID